jgi:hypothetical protein
MSFLSGVLRLFPKTHVAIVCLIAAPLVSLILAPTSDDSVARVSREGLVSVGYVGATGWARAPHLRYEFLVDGAHQSPRTVPLPKAQPIPSKQLVRFKAQSEPLLAQLANRPAEMQLARVQ